MTKLDISFEFDTEDDEANLNWLNEQLNKVFRNAKAYSIGMAEAGDSE